MSWNIKTPGDYINGPLTVAGSATITGDLTVRTTGLTVNSSGVGVGVTASLGAGIIQIGAGKYLGYSATAYMTPEDNVQGARIKANNILVDATSESKFNIGGTLAMTLNSTGLGIGVSPSYAFQIKKTLSGTSTTVNPLLYLENNGAGNSAKITLTDGISNNGYIVYSNETGNSLLGLGVGSAQQLVVNASGNVGIGVTPSAWASIYRTLELPNGSSIWGQTDTPQLSLQTNAFLNSSFAWIYKTTAAASNYRQTAGSHLWFNAPSGTAGNAITFTQAMTLDASGNLLVGTTSVLNSARVSLKAASVATVLSLNGVTGDTAQESFVINKFDSNSTTSQVFARFTNGNGSGGSGQINGNGANACAFGSFSDSRLKENILTLPSQLANILSLRPVEFDYKDGSGHQIGFIAQEMQGVYSDAVGEQNGFLTVTGWSKTEARLVSAIKELAAKVQSLEAKLA